MDLQARQQAIEMREAAVPVREVAARTGLSVPTVVALHKAYRTGGMAAVLARKPGRPARTVDASGRASAGNPCR